MRPLWRWSWDWGTAHPRLGWRAVAGAAGPRSPAEAWHPSLHDMDMRLVYLHTLRAARRFPSVKREGILQEIKREFREGRLVRDAAEVAKRRRLALESLGQLQEYVGAARRGVDASVYLRGGLQSGE